MIEDGSCARGHQDQDWQDDFLSNLRDRSLVLLLVCRYHVPLLIVTGCAGRHIR